MKKEILLTSLQKNSTMKIVIENVSDGENIPHNILLIRGRVDNLDSSLLEGKMI